MNKLPSNPAILISILNMKLRDFYSSLDDLCDDLDEDKNEIVEITEQSGYYYDADSNQFRLK